MRALVCRVSAKFATAGRNDCRARNQRRSFNLHRWALKLLPVLTAVCRRRKRPVGISWRMDETYVKINGQWQYLYRAVDRNGATIDFMLRGKRDLAAARSFFERAMALHDRPAKVAIDKSGVNLAAIQSLQRTGQETIAIRQSKYLNNVVERDHRAVKRIVCPMLGFKSFCCAEIIIASIETMHMIRKGQLADIKDPNSSVAN